MQHYIVEVTEKLERSWNVAVTASNNDEARDQADARHTAGELDRDKAIDRVIKNPTRSRVYQATREEIENETDICDFTEEDEEKDWSVTVRVNARGRTSEQALDMVEELCHFELPFVVIDAEEVS